MKGRLVLQLQPLLPLLLVAAAASFAIGPHQASDWFWRPKFVQACIVGAGGRTDDDTIRICNAAWSRRVALEVRDWK